MDVVFLCIFDVVIYLTVMKILQIIRTTDYSLFI